MLRIYTVYNICNLRLNKRICQGFDFSSGQSWSDLIIAAAIITEMVNRHEVLY